MAIAPATRAAAADMAEPLMEEALPGLSAVGDDLAGLVAVPVAAAEVAAGVPTTMVPLPPGFCPTGAEGANVPGLPLGSVIVKRVV